MTWMSGTSMRNTCRKDETMNQPRTKGAATNQEQTNAQAAYHATRLEIGDLLARIKQRLIEDQKAASEHPHDWGYAGSLAHVRDELRNLLAYLTQA
jgi:hypothetical protein